MGALRARAGLGVGKGKEREHDEEERGEAGPSSLGSGGHINLFEDLEKVCSHDCWRQLRLIVHRCRKTWRS